MFLSDLAVAPFILNTDPSDTSFDFNSIKPQVFNENRKISYKGKLFKLTDLNTVVPEIIKTDPPVITGPDGLNENAGSDFTFTMPDGADIVVWSKKGSIISLDKSGLKFTYIAPDIVNSTLDTTDEIYAYTIKPGELRSDTVVKEITVHYVPLLADDALSNPDFKTYEDTSKNIEYL